MTDSIADEAKRHPTDTAFLRAAAQHSWGLAEQLELAAMSARSQARRTFNAIGEEPPASRINNGVEMLRGALAESQRWLTGGSGRHTVEGLMALIAKNDAVLGRGER